MHFGVFFSSNNQTIVKVFLLRNTTFRALASMCAADLGYRETLLEFTVRTLPSRAGVSVIELEIFRLFRWMVSGKSCRVCCCLLFPALHEWFKWQLETRFHLAQKSAAFLQFDILLLLLSALPIPEPPNATRAPGVSAPICFHTPAVYSLFSTATHT